MALLVCFPTCDRWAAHGRQAVQIRVETEVTDAGLEHLKALTKLRYLNLEGTQFADDALEKLQQALPRCKIEH